MRSRAGLIVAAVFGVCHFAAVDGRACGFSWEAPSSYFEDVDYQGYFSLAEKLGTLSLGDGKSIPVFAIFGSNKKLPSPYLGYGWQMPLLEAKMYQLDENCFRMDQPDGRFRLFWRDPKKPQILNGQGGWKAEIKGDTVIASADCGARLVFNAGRISSMTVFGEELTFVYESNRVTSLRRGNVDLLKINFDPSSRDVTGFTTSDGRRIKVEMGSMPKVQEVQQSRLISTTEKTLSKVSLDNGSKLFEFGVDGALNQTLQIGTRVLVWDPTSRLAIRDGDWTYEITPGARIFDNAAIKRINSSGENEFWFYDAQKGQETKIGRSGWKIQQNWFTSGILAGRQRSRTLSAIPAGGSQEQISESLKRFYDDQGRVLRVTKTEADGGARTSSIAYASDGTKVESSFAGETRSMSFGPNGRLLRVDNGSGAALDVGRLLQQIRQNLSQENLK